MSKSRKFRRNQVLKAVPPNSDQSLTIPAPPPSLLSEPDAPHRNRFAFIMPCMGRLEHVKVSVPALLASPEIDGVHNTLIFVDYHCPQESGRWVKSQFGSRVHVLRVADLEMPTEKGVFNKPVAHNSGAMQAIEWGADYFVFIDADTLATPDLIQYLLHNLTLGQFLIFEPSLRWLDLTGFLAVHRRHFIKVNGFDAKFAGWGAEDLDIRLRLHLYANAPANDPRAVLKSTAHALPWGEIPSILAESIPHEDAQRTAHYEQKDKDESHRVNLNLLCANIFAKLGVHPLDLHETPLGSAIRRLLGMELNINPRALD